MMKNYSTTLLLVQLKVDSCYCFAFLFDETHLTYKCETERPLVLIIIKPNTLENVKQIDFKVPLNG